MINAINSTSQVVNANATVPFLVNRICTGCSTKHEQGSARFILLKPGIYNVSLSSIFTSTDTGTAILSIEVDGETVAGGTISNTIVTAGNISSGYVSIPVRVYNCGGTVITINNLSTIPLTLNESAVTIERIC